MQKAEEKFKYLEQMTQKLRIATDQLITKHSPPPSIKNDLSSSTNTSPRYPAAITSSPPSQSCQASHRDSTITVASSSDSSSSLDTSSVSRTLREVSQLTSMLKKKRQDRYIQDKFREFIAKKKEPTKLEHDIVSISQDRAPTKRGNHSEYHVRFEHDTTTTTTSQHENSTWMSSENQPLGSVPIVNSTVVITELKSKESNGKEDISNKQETTNEDELLNKLLQDSSFSRVSYPTVFIQPSETSTRETKNSRSDTSKASYKEDTDTSFESSFIYTTPPSPHSGNDTSLSFSFADLSDSLDSDAESTSEVPSKVRQVLFSENSSESSSSPRPSSSPELSNAGASSSFFTSLSSSSDRDEPLSPSPLVGFVEPNNKDDGSTKVLNQPKCKSTQFLIGFGEIDGETISSAALFSLSSSEEEDTGTSTTGRMTSTSSNSIGQSHRDDSSPNTVFFATPSSVSSTTVGTGGTRPLDYSSSSTFWSTSEDSSQDD